MESSSESEVAQPLQLDAGALVQQDYSDDDEEGEAEDCFDPARDKVWQQNAALCRNFEELKHLYSQSTKLIFRLQATCTTLRREKESMQRSLFSISADNSSRDVQEQQQQGLDQLGAGAIRSASEGPDKKRIAQLEAEKQELLRRIELAKSFDKRLEVGAADRASEAAWESTSKSFNPAQDKDALIFDLQQALQQLSSENKRSAEKKEYEEEVKRLQEIVAQKEKQEQVAKALHAEETELKVTDALLKARVDEERQREIRRAFENEIADLRALLTAVEQTSAEAELRHLNSLSEFMKEKDLLHEEAADFQNRHKMLEDKLSKAQQEHCQVQAQLGDSQLKLQEAKKKVEDSEVQAANYRREQHEVQKRLEMLQNEIAEIVKLRDNDRQSHMQNVEDVKRNCDILWRRKEEASKEKRNALRRKIQQLQKKLKYVHKQFARLTFDCNELLIYKKEYEAQLTTMQNARQLVVQSQMQSSSSAAIDRSLSKTKVITAEINHLAARQARYL